MARTLSRIVAALALLGVAVAWLTPHVAGQAGTTGFPSTKNGEWTHYTADARGSKYSPLDQINASNFGKHEVAWRFKTDNLGTRPEYKLEGTPLMVKGVVYTTAGTRRSVVALDAKTGELLWVYSMREGTRAANAPRYRRGNCPDTACRIGATDAAMTVSCMSPPAISSWRSTPRPGR